MIKNILNPDLYHGKNKKHNFFEGWYFKVVDYSEEHPLSIIPGIFKGRDNESFHSFIQVLLGQTNKYFYNKYDVNLFSYSDSEFKLWIEDNYFSLSGLKINIDRKDIRLRGELRFINLKKWPDSKINPGSMGFYNYLSFMQCYSQVCAIDMSVEGSLNINGEGVDFTKGKGYIEKNWGRAFPYAWIWIQCNCFKNSKGALSCSIGHIPFPLGSFRGFLIGFEANDRFYSFTTMNKSKINIAERGSDVIIRARNNNLLLTIKTKSSEEDFILCNGPRDDKMIPLVQESVRGEVTVELKDTCKNKILFCDIGSCAGIEYGGEQMKILN